MLVYCRVYSIDEIVNMSGSFLSMPFKETDNRTADNNTVGKVGGGGGLLRCVDIVIQDTGKIGTGACCLDGIT